MARHDEKTRGGDVEQLLRQFFARELPASRPLPPVPALEPDHSGKQLRPRHRPGLRAVAAVALLAAASIAVAVVLWPVRGQPGPDRSTPAPAQANAVQGEPADGERAPVTARVVPYVVFDELEGSQVEQVQRADGSTMLIRAQTGWRHLLVRDQEEGVATWYAFPVIEIAGSVASAD